MPIYDYRCGGCGQAFERLVRGGETVTCPRCAGGNLERLLSVTARPAIGSTKSTRDGATIPHGGGGCCGGGCGSHSH